LPPQNLQAFSSQVVALGDSENAIIVERIFKPSGSTWRLGKCDQTTIWNMSGERKRTSHVPKGAASLRTAPAHCVNRRGDFPQPQMKDRQTHVRNH
jgi:hypothetical protein